MVLDLTTQQGAMPASGSDDFDVAPPAGVPNVDGQSQDQIAGLLREVNAGGTPQAAPVVPPVAAPAPGQDPLEQLPPKDDAVTPEGNVKDTRTPEEKAVDDKAADKQANILKKFGIENPSEAVSKLVKSYGEAETIGSQTMQAKSDVDRLTKENETVLGIADDLQREVLDLKKAPATAQTDPNAQMTDKEIEDYNTNPKAAIAKAVQDALKPVQQQNQKAQAQGERDRVMDVRVLSEVNKFKGDKKFDGLEKDVDTILKDDNLPYTPQSVAIAYHAARSIRMGEIVTTAKNEGFTTGYNKAMDEVKRGVDGGRSTVPAQGSQGLGGFTEDQIEAMSADQLGKIVPNSGR